MHSGLRGSGYDRLLRSPIETAKGKVIRPKARRDRAVNRRSFITVFGGTAVSWPLAVRAQQAERMRRIGVLMGTARSKLGESHLATFLRRLEELKWVQGRSARIEVRWWTAGTDDMRPVVAELLAFAPDV